MTVVDLDGVPETMLWPLWNRAHESRRDDRLIDDPWSIALVDRIDYDFGAHFGKPNRGHGIRSRVGDDLIRDFLSRTGDAACIVALGEGLETSYWRLGEPNVPWLSVDLPESIQVRERLLPRKGTMRMVPLSALDFAWMDRVPAGHTPFISAMGLLMYFTEEDNRRLLSAIAARFSNAEIYFDAIPPMMSRRTLKGLKVTKTYQAPAMPWGISNGQLSAFLRAVSFEPITVQTYAEPFPRAMRLFSLLSKISLIREALAPSLVHARARTATVV